MYVGEQHRYRSHKKHILNRIGLKPAASQAMSNYERTGHTVVRGTALYYRRSLHCGSINIPPLTNMEATGCRLAMTGHSTLVIVSVYLRLQTVAPARPKSPLCLRDAVILFSDFNCKNIRWGCPSNNYNGIKLDELEDRLDFGIIAPSTSTCFPHVVTHRPSTIDIALTKGVALNFNSIETIHGLTSDHRPVILKMGPPDGGRPIPFRKITNWKRVSTALEKIDTPNLNSIPPMTSQQKNAALRRASAYPTPEYRSRARALQREVKARVREFRNESWSDLMEEIKPSHKAFWAVTKALKTEDIPYTPLKT
ncbi:Probable RNA-directed DNA polymerase from transposon X-element [Eumeta japonica]|uniref:Probable RNA-directed DNA polymerase from transposon X-element n=1 Tax=Eumeta variegata TaxID=151549 RepID=A0A4C1XLB2_EUMVA|nr:Probable RNA-directed DNA polymerase from transposon X-element [Eumeta japonica]